MTDDPRDTPTTIYDEREYWLNREQVIFMTMKADGKVATDAQAEIARIVDAWYRGESFPRSAAPTVAMLLEVDPRDEQPPEPPAPIEIAGGVAGFQKLLVEMAKQNRGLDHAALKQLFDAHEVVTAVWENPDVPMISTSTFPTCWPSECKSSSSFAHAKKARAMSIASTSIPSSGGSICCSTSSLDWRCWTSSTRRRRRR